MGMARPEDDDFFEEDEPVEEIFERYARAQGGLTSLPPGAQVLPSGTGLLVWSSAGHAGGQTLDTDHSRAVWPSSGHYVSDRDSLVQA